LADRLAQNGTRPLALHYDTDVYYSRASSLGLGRRFSQSSCRGSSARAILHHRYAASKRCQGVGRESNPAWLDLDWQWLVNAEVSDERGFRPVEFAACRS